MFHSAILTETNDPERDERADLGYKLKIVFN